MQRPIVQRTVCVFYLVLVAAAVPLLFADGGVPLWTNRYGGVGSVFDYATAIAVDTSNNVSVTGYSSGSATSYDFATIQYTPTGVPLWTNRYNGPGNGDDHATAIAVDNNGTVFVTGDSWSNDDSYDYATTAYSNAGVPLWTNRYRGPANSYDWATAIAVDRGGNGNVYVAGYSGSSFNSPSKPDYVTVAYANAGILLWTNRYGGAGNGDDRAYALAVAPSGDVIVSGISADGTTYSDCATIAYSSAGEPLWTNRYNGGGNAIVTDIDNNVIVTGDSAGDYLTIKYSSAGTPLWTNRYGGPGNGSDRANAVGVDRAGNVFVTGSSVGVSSADYATIAYSSDGTALWTNRYGGYRDNFATAIAVAANGIVFVTGKSYGDGSAYDYATIAYSSTGESLWTNRYSGPLNQNDEARGVAVDSSGNVIVTGYSWGGSTSAFDFVTIKYSAFLPLAYLDLQDLNHQLVLTWTNAAFDLESAPAITGNFTNIPNATSPYTNPIIGPQQFFRLISN